MAISATISFNTIMTGTPEGSITLGPLVDTAASANDQMTILAATTSYQQLTIPAGTTHVLIYWASTTGNLIIAGGNTDTGINMGLTGTWAKLPLLASGTLWAKMSSSTANITFRWV